MIVWSGGCSSRVDACGGGVGEVEAGGEFGSAVVGVEEGEAPEFGGEVGDPPVGIVGEGVGLLVGLGAVTVGEGVEVGVVVGHGGLPSVISYAPGCSRRYVWYCSSLVNDDRGTVRPWSQIAALQAAAGAAGRARLRLRASPAPARAPGRARGMLSAGIGRWLLSVLSPGGGGYDTIVRAQS
jgi:hypothetical protein